MDLSVGTCPKTASFIEAPARPLLARADEGSWLGNDPTEQPANVRWLCIAAVFSPPSTPSSLIGQEDSAVIKISYKWPDLTRVAL